MDWNAFLSTLGLVFVAELGDKTQLAVVTQTCKFRRPWAVFLGASIGLTSVTLVGAIGGRFLGQFLPPELLRTVAALAFLAMGAIIGREAYEAGREDACVPACEGMEESPSRSAAGLNGRIFAATFVLLFVAELGDKTQLAVLSLSSRNGATWSVFAGGALALTLVTGLGVVGGQGLCRLIPERALLWAASVAFGLMGVVMLLGWF